PPVSACTLVPEHLRATVAVISDCRSAHQILRPLPRFSESLSNQLCSLDPAVADSGLSSCCPAARSYVLTCQVDDRINAVQYRGINGSRVRTPFGGTSHPNHFMAASR